MVEILTIFFNDKNEWEHLLFMNFDYSDIIYEHIQKYFKVFFIVTERDIFLQIF